MYIYIFTLVLKDTSRNLFTLLSAPTMAETSTAIPAADPAPAQPGLQPYQPHQPPNHPPIVRRLSNALRKTFPVRRNSTSSISRPLSASAPPGASATEEPLVPAAHPQEQSPAIDSQPHLPERLEKDDAAVADAAQPPNTSSDHASSKPGILKRIFSHPQDEGEPAAAHQSQSPEQEEAAVDQAQLPASPHHHRHPSDSHARKNERYSFTSPKFDADTPFDVLAVNDVDIQDAVSRPGMPVRTKSTQQVDRLYSFSGLPHDVQNASVAPENPESKQAAKPSTQGEARSGSQHTGSSQIAEQNDGQIEYTAPAQAPAQAHDHAHAQHPRRVSLTALDTNDVVQDHVLRTASRVLHPLKANERPPWSVDPQTLERERSQGIDPLCSGDTLLAEREAERVKAARLEHQREEREEKRKLAREHQREAKQEKAHEKALEQQQQHASQWQDDVHDQRRGSQPAQQQAKASSSHPPPVTRAHTTGTMPWTRRRSSQPAPVTEELGSAEHSSQVSPPAQEGASHSARAHSPSGTGASHSPPLSPVGERLGRVLSFHRSNAGSPPPVPGPRRYSGLMHALDTGDFVQDKVLAAFGGVGGASAHGRRSSAAGPGSPVRNPSQHQDQVEGKVTAPLASPSVSPKVRPAGGDQPNIPSLGQALH